MKIQFKDVEQAPYRFDETLELEPVSELVENDSLVGVGEIHSQGELSFVDPGYLLRSELEYERTLMCDRCLEEFAEPVRSELTLIVVRRPAHAGDVAETLDSEVQLDEDDLDISVVEGEELDTEPLLRENVLLNVPMKPLCSKDCQGLCPECGQKKEDGCGCSAPTDDRWRALAALRDQLPES